MDVQQFHKIKNYLFKIYFEKLFEKWVLKKNKILYATLAKSKD
jgi:hypothetical protein